ncbi:hypothetical protein [uncultured Nitratireductor sp.]|uniref:hypothetical protein n=1 Tax=uncultured Nitratireductor sp. TaxID=520953 RepID=UPI002627C33C|nr:hypothetical protein [uncultured Nitratireductor sp.]
MDMKYFILDIHDGPNGAVANCVDALRIAALPDQAEIFYVGHDVFVNLDLNQELFQKLFQKATEQLRDADIIISFTDRNLLAHSRHFPAFREEFYKKIDNRTPFFFQFMDIWETYHAPNSRGADPFLKHYYIELLTYLGIHPTGIRVYNSDRSEYYRKFTPEFEPTAIDPGVSNAFQDVGSVGIFEANLMTFGEGNSALLRSHDRNYHDLRRDPGAGAPNFERHSPFIMRKTENHFGYFVSGTFMAVKFHHIAQKTAVPETNIVAISSIVRELQSNVRLARDANNIMSSGGFCCNG